MLNEILRFNGTWRTYQQRVLNHFEQYARDGKIHIVAAPGSGKTTLGIELIRRVNAPVLILAPTITIREQWGQRIREAFLADRNIAEDIISFDLKSPRLITIATYQALHCAMTRYAGIVKENDEFGTEETVDYSNFDVIASFRNSQLGTICLDECHHLRNEWWKSLEQFKSGFPYIFTVALTATPPFDSTPAMWTRYIDMCGGIDEEITVPELVKDGTLCPHQDYVYFNYPTKEEEQQLAQFENDAIALMYRLMQDGEFTYAITSHPFLTGTATDEAMLEYPAYLSSMLIYLCAKGMAYPQRCQNLLGFNQLEPMSLKWMEILLQGFLYDDADSFYVNPAYRENLIREMKEKGLIEKRKVQLTVSAELERMVINSSGKCASIRDIVFHEYASLGPGLRLLILTDYIRKEWERVLGDSEKPADILGVLPFFEQIRREAAARNSTIRLGVLCGTIVIIPSEATDALLSLVDNPGKIAFAPAGKLQDYVKVQISGDSHFITDAVSRLFEMGYMQVLIGTKSLLGEGWDSPCVNSLILASFVGSYMLSNQMRGRAIRIFRENPNKTSNIWHLVCVRQRKGLRDSFDDGSSEDFRLLFRRMEHFLGLHYAKDEIENGMERLSIIRPPFTPANVQRINQQMLNISANRAILRDRWYRSLVAYDKIETVHETGVQEKFITSVVLFDAIRSLLISAGILLAGILGLFMAGAGIFTPLWIIILSLLNIPFISKICVLGSPLKRLKAFGNGIRNALGGMRLLDSLDSIVETESLFTFHLVYLHGGTGRDKALFAQCVDEFFSEIDNQRYLLYKKSRRNHMDGYFAVPECFSKRKEDAEFFARMMQPYIGKYEPVYTRNENGRKILLAGRIKALSNRERRCISKRRAKGALE